MPTAAVAHRFTRLSTLAAPQDSPLVPSAIGAARTARADATRSARGSHQGPGAISEAHGMAALCSPDT